MFQEVSKVLMCVYLPALQQRGKSKGGFQACFSAPEDLSLAGKDELTSPEDDQKHENHKTDSQVLLSFYKNDQDKW